MLTREDRKVDMKYNFKVYFGFIKKYKLLVVGLLIITLILESTLAIEKFLFKIIIDKGTDFSKGILLANNFINILLIVASVFAFLFLLRSFLKWMHIHLINVLDSNLILDLKRKFFQSHNSLISSLSYFKQNRKLNF